MQKEHLKGDTTIETQEIKRKDSDIKTVNRMKVE